ncbi:MAG: sugar-binding domain-containing protein, partial [Bacillota bacterium]
MVMPTKPQPNGRRTDHGHAYPRPQLVREQWTNLNGPWDFAIDLDAQWDIPEEVDWTGVIRVPFAPETPASGIENTSFYHACWYRRTIPTPTLQAGQRLLLHFGAVDWEATVWVNGKLAVHHEGGYTPFQADITDLLVEGDEQVIAVRACDNPHDLHKPRGKQDWCLNAHSIWYWRTTGIWQTVWLERVPRSFISRLRWTPSVERWHIELDAYIAGQGDG